MFWLLCNVGVGDFPDSGTPNAGLSSHGTSLIAALRHCGCSGPRTYLEGVYYEVLQPIAAVSCSAPRRSAMWAGLDTCKACFDG